MKKIVAETLNERFNKYSLLHANYDIAHKLFSKDTTERDKLLSPYKDNLQLYLSILTVSSHVFYSEDINVTIFDYAQNKGWFKEKKEHGVLEIKNSLI
jgi:hypothetical protein